MNCFLSCALPPPESAVVTVKAADCRAELRRPAGGGNITALCLPTTGAYSGFDLTAPPLRSRWPPYRPPRGQRPGDTWQRPGPPAGCPRCRRSPCATGWPAPPPATGPCGAGSSIGFSLHVPAAGDPCMYIPRNPPSGQFPGSFAAWFPCNSSPPCTHHAAGQ